MVEWIVEDEDSDELYSPEILEEEEQATDGDGKQVKV